MFEPEIYGEFGGSRFALTFAEGEWVKNIRISATDDLISESDEFGTLTMIEYLGGELYSTAASHTIQVFDNEVKEKSEIGFTVTDITCNQLDLTAELTVERTMDTTYPITVEYQTTDITAQAGEQYAEAKGTLLFSGDITQNVIKIPLIAENEREEQLSFKVDLINVHGGTKEDLCKIVEGKATATVNLYCLGEITAEEGLNLASVLKKDNVEDISGNVQVSSESVLPGEEIITTEQTEEQIEEGINVTYGSDTASGNAALYITAPNQIMSYKYPDAQSIKIRRDASNYDGIYWQDEEYVAGAEDKYRTAGYRMSKPEFEANDNGSLDSEKNTFKTDFTDDFLYPNQVRIRHNDNTTSSFVSIDKAGLMFDNARWEFYAATVGVNRLRDEAHYYAQPVCYVNQDNTAEKFWCGDGSVDENEGKYYLTDRKSSFDLDLNDNSLWAVMGINFHIIGETWECFTKEWNDTYKAYDKELSANACTDFRMKYLCMRRRYFSNTDSIGLKIYTANDKNCVLDEEGNEQTDIVELEATGGEGDIYTSIRPDITLVPGKGGVTQTGKLYVGSQLMVKMKNTDSYKAYQSATPSDTIYVTDSKGNRKNCEVSISSDKTYYIITLMWSGMEEADLAETYTLHVVMERKQDVSIDISQSGLTETEFRQKQNIQCGYSTFNRDTGEKYEYMLTPYSVNSSDLTTSESNLVLSGNKIANIHWISFGMDERDRILFNGRVFAGNDKIYLTVKDLALSSLQFYYISKDNTSVPQTMKATIQKTGLYYDVNGNGRIDGYFNESTGYFISEDENEFIGFIDGQFDEKMFQPVVDEDGTVHQYFLKAYYTMNPRCLTPIAGDNVDKRVLVIPAFTTTLSDYIGNLTDEQKGHSFIHTSDTRSYPDETAYGNGKPGDYKNSSEGHYMYGAKATVMSYVDIPLGGDKSPVKEVRNDKGERTGYTWTPNYKGNLLVDYPNPEPITNTTNLTQKAVSLCGGNYKKFKIENGLIEYSYTDKGKAMNQYLGSFAGASVYQLAVQEGNSIDEISMLSDLIPESYTNGNVSSIPNSDYLQDLDINATDAGSADPKEAGTDFGDFLPDFGIQLPSGDIGISDYATIINDGYDIGFSINIPIAKREKDLAKSTTNQTGQSGQSGQSGQTGNTSTPSTKKTVKEEFAEANQGFSDFKDWLKAPNATKKDDFVDSFIGDNYKNANNGKACTKGVEASLAVSLGILFRYNPLDNKHYFYQFTLAASVSVEATIESRLPACPIFYVYCKFGASMTVTTGLTVTRCAVEDKEVVELKGVQYDEEVEKAREITFKTNYKAFHMDFTGKVFMAAYYADEFDRRNTDAEVKPVASGNLTSDGKTTTEVIMLEADGMTSDRQIIVTLTTLSPITRIERVANVTEVKSAVTWNGLTISPEFFVEVGAGVGVEMLKFEIYLKLSLAMTISVAPMSADPVTGEVSVAGLSLDDFNLNLSLGLHVQVLLFDYSIDLVGMYVKGHANSAGENEWEFGWSALGDKYGGSEDVSHNSVNGESVISQNSVAQTQRLTIGDEDILQAVDADDKDVEFQLSGYGSAGNAVKLINGLSIGYSYKVCNIGNITYMVYPICVNDEGLAERNRKQLVLSKVLLEGATMGLQNPVDADSSTPYIFVDYNGVGADGEAGDMDFDISVADNKLYVTYTCLCGDTLTDESTIDEVGKNLCVKSAVFDTTDGFSEALTLSTEGDANVPVRGKYIFNPQSVGNKSFYVQADGESSVKAQNDKLKKYIEATNKLVGTDGNGDGVINIEEADSNDASNQLALFEYRYRSDNNRLNGNGNRVFAQIYSETDSKVTTVNDEEAMSNEYIESMDAIEVGDDCYLAYTTAEIAYFDSEGKTVELRSINDKTDRAVIRRLYIRSLNEEQQSLSSPKLCRTAIDFEECTSSNIGTRKLRDGLYSNGTLVQEEADPNFGNLHFLHAKYKEENAEILLVFSMGRNTYIMNEVAIKAADDATTATIDPFFHTDEKEAAAGNEVTIGSDSEGNIAAVYISGVAGSNSNKICAAWWNQELNAWGEGTVLAMNHLQVYEDSITYGLSPNESEKAYLGQKTGNADYDSYIDALTQEQKSRTKGDMDMLMFRNLQMVAYKSGGETPTETLTVFTEGSFSNLKKAVMEDTEDKKEIVIKAPVYFDQTGKRLKGIPDNTVSYESRSEDLGFYAIGFGAGRQEIGEGTINISTGDFSTGSRLTGALSFRNTGSAGIRAGGEDHPIKASLIAVSEGGTSQKIASWMLKENIPSGQKVRLTFISEALNETLTTGSKLQLSIQEDNTYFNQNSAFSTSIDLLTVEEKPEISIVECKVDVSEIEANQVRLNTTFTVGNHGSSEAKNVFVQLSCESGEGDNKVKKALSITENELFVNDSPITGANFDKGIIPIGNMDVESTYKVTGSFLVDKNFLESDGTTEIMLEYEAFSDAGSRSLDASTGLYYGSHGEFNELNNHIIGKTEQITRFNVAENISLSMGNTLNLPVNAVSTSKNGCSLDVCELPSGDESTTDLFGILYYDSSRNCVSMAPSREGTGIIRLTDRNTGSFKDIVCATKQMGEGINIYKDNASFSFYNADETKCNANGSNTGDWQFLDNVDAKQACWGMIENENLAPMNFDLSIAKKEGANVKFSTLANTMTLYFDGEISISSNQFTADVSHAKESPVVINFGNDTGMKHTVTITAHGSNTRLDRYIETYSDGVNPIAQKDTESPHIFWNRSFPDTASLISGEDELHLTAYILDESGIGYVESSEDSAVLTKISDTLWKQDFVITSNHKLTLNVKDLSGNAAGDTVRVDWFNTSKSSNANAYAPELNYEDALIVKSNGEAVTEQLPIGEYGYFNGTKYDKKKKETSTASMFVHDRANGTADFTSLLTADKEDNFTIYSNGYYEYRVTAEDGSFSRVIRQMVYSSSDANYTVSLQSGKGYTIEAVNGSANPVHKGDNFSFKLKVLPGYTRTKDFAVFVNGVSVPLASDLTYTIPDIRENINVTACGVTDKTAPTIEIAVAADTWRTFIETITLGIFSNHSLQVGISAADTSKEEVNVSYLISDMALDAAHVVSSKNWTTYNGCFYLESNRGYFIYAKAVDASGNVSYAGTDGIVIDSILPQISGIEDSKSYCGPVEVYVADEYIKNITVNGTEVKLKDNHFTLMPNETKQCVVVTDKAGNENSVTVMVYAHHQFTEPVWTWNGYEEAHAFFTCSIDPGHTELVAAEINQNITRTPTATEEGECVYTAYVFKNGVRYESTKTEVLPVVTKEIGNNKKKDISKADSNGNTGDEQEAISEEAEEVFVELTDGKTSAKKGYIWIWGGVGVAFISGLAAVVFILRKRRTF